MRTHALHGDLLGTTQGDRSWLARLLHAVLSRFLLLPLAAAIAVLWANTDPEAYFRFAHANAFWVNDIAMAVFLGLIAQELFEAMMPGGELSSWRHWGMCVIAAIGGLAGSVVAFWLFIDFYGVTMLAPAWPVAAAVDMAAGYYVMRLLYPRRTVPIAFVLLVAAITNAIAMVAVTLADPGFHPHAGGLLVTGAAIGTAALMRRRSVKNFSAYAACAVGSWLGLYWLGIHPALALIPIVPLMPHQVRPREVFSAPPEDSRVHRAEAVWNAWAQIAVFMFGLVNAGVILKHFDTGSWAVLFAALIGRPAGIAIAVGLAVAGGLTLPRQMRAADLAVAALATSSGFTFALFLGAVAIPAGAVSGQVTIGALATAFGALLTIGVARVVSAGTHRHQVKPHGVPSETRSPAG